MRTSRASKDTAKVLQALSPPARRQTRSSQALSMLRDFAYNGGGSTAASISDDDTSSLSSVPTVDIEDLLEPPAKRQKSALSDPPPTGTRSPAPAALPATR